jgi:hypothetical protein
LSVLIPILAFFTLAAWSLSSAPGSSPDDDFHLPSIWCGQGERPGLCEASAVSELEREVPSAVVGSTCYAFRSDLSADCWHSAATGLESVDRVNTGGTYPPVFYAAMSVLASSDVAASVVAMRLLNSAFAVALLSAAFFALPRRLRPALVIGVVGTAVPLGLFVFASTNPSSWALLSAAVTWVSLYGATQTAGRRSLVLSGLAVFGALVGAGARADSAAFAVFGVLLVAILASRRRASTLGPAIAAACIVVVCAVFFLTSRQSAAVTDPGATESLGVGQHLSNFLGVPMLWTGALGGAGLGWLDTPMPAVVSVLSFATFAGALYLGVARAERRRAIAVGLGIAAMWLVPFVLIFQWNVTVDSLLVQPRYVLPLLTMTLGIASLRPGSERRWTGAAFVLAAASLAIAQAIALFQNIRRYTVGIGAQSLGIGSDTAWWWEAGPSAVVVLIGGSVAFAALLALLGCTFWVRRVPARTRKATATHTSAGEAPAVDAPGAAADPIAEPSSHTFER